MTSTTLLRLTLARELLELDLANRTLHALLIALRLVHPTLHHDSLDGDPKSLRLARALAEHAALFRKTARSYRHAVTQSLPTLRTPEPPF